MPKSISTNNNDSLLQTFDNIYQVRKSLIEREAGYIYFQGYSELMDALVRTALELELPGNALMHLEMQKSIILINRLKYLLRDKPVDLPEALWEDLQRFIALYRGLVEGADNVETGLEGLADYTIQDVEDAISRKLWECSQISEIGTKQIQQKLAFGRFPQQIECAEPKSTLILEFCPGACFLIRPDNPLNPEVIELPEATPQENKRLVQDLFEIVQEWLDHYSRSSSLAAVPSSHRLTTFLTRFDEIFYRPIAHKLDQAKVKNICIIPHRLLHVLPLNLLGLSDQSQSTLGERFAVSFAPSLTCLKGLSNPFRQKPERCLVVTNPVPLCPAECCRNPNHDCFSIDEAEQENHVLTSLLKALDFDVINLHGKQATLKAVSRELGSSISCILLLTAFSIPNIPSTVDYC